MSKRIVQVDKAKIPCDGGTASSHPQVWLQIDAQKGYTVCPYCETKFVKTGDNAH